MDMNGPVTENMREVVKDIDAIVKELMTVCVKPDKSENDTKTLESLTRLFDLKEQEFIELHSRYLHRHKVRAYIKELEKVERNQDQKLEVLNDGIRTIYDNLAELTRRIEKHTEYNKPDNPIDCEDIVKTAHLYSEAYSIAAPPKGNPNNLGPFPTVDEMKKGKLIMHTKTKRMKSQQQQNMGEPYTLIFNQTPLNMKDQLAKYRLSSMMPSSSSTSTSANQKIKKEKPKVKTEENLKTNSKIWTHYRPRYESIKNAEWNEKALAPTGFIETPSGSNREVDGGSDGIQGSTRRPTTPEWPMTRFIPIHEKHATYFKALIENHEEDLLQNEERMKPASVQSADFIEADNLEAIEQYQKILEHSKQKYYSSFQEETPWLEKPGTEKSKKKPNYLFRLRSSAYFYQQRITKRSIWNAKYNRFYRNYKFRSPKLAVFPYPHPRRIDDHVTGLIPAEGSWNLRKWTLSSTIQALNP